MSETLTNGDNIFRFKGWRFPEGTDHQLPAQVNGEDQFLPNEMIYVDDNGTEIFVSPEAPIFSSNDPKV